MKIVLGTAQFGSNYGISNKEGQIEINNARKVIETAKKNKIDTIDTAVNYGDSELNLGSIGLNQLKIITKLSHPSDTSTLNIEKWINHQLEESLKKMKINKLEGLLIHNTHDKDLFMIKEIWNNLLKFKEKKIVKNIGFSIYDPSEIEDCLKYFQPDIVQCPFNAFDRRIINSGLIGKLKRIGTKIHIRSIFLQGLLLMSDDQIPSYFKRWDEKFKEWRKWLLKNNFTPLEGCLYIAFRENIFDNVVIGVENENQLIDILNYQLPTNLNIQDNLSVDEEELINPYMWKNS